MYQISTPAPPFDTLVTGLFIACIPGHSKAALLLLSKGADPNKAAKGFIKYENEEEFAQVRNPLYLAVKRRDTKLVSSLLERGADPNKGEKMTFENGRVSVRTPLYAAVKTFYRTNVSTEVVRGLLERGADPNKETRSTQLDGDVYEETPLYVAAKIGSTEIVRILLERGARQDLDGGGGEIG